MHVSTHLSRHHVRTFLSAYFLQAAKTLILRQAGQASRSAAFAATKGGSVAAMRRNGNCFVQAGPGGSASAAVASERSLARRSMRGHGGVTGAMRLHVLRLALVILCLPRTAGSPMITILAPSSPPPSPFTVSGCQQMADSETVENTFFSTDLSPAFFPHSGYTPVPDPDPSECDLTIGVDWMAGEKGGKKRKAIMDLVPNAVICVKPGKCE